MSDLDDILEDADANAFDEDDEDKEYGFVERSRAASLSTSDVNSARGRIATLIFGTDVQPDEIKRIMVLASALFAIEMSDGIFHSVQDPIFGAVVGLNFKPLAMAISFAATIIILCFYSKVVGCHSRRHDLFGFFANFFFGLFMLNALFLIHPSIGALGARAADPLRILGWFTFSAIDQFGIIMINLFWSFTNSVVPLSSAKATYGVVFAIGQLGNLAGSLLFHFFGSVVGISACFVLGIMSILLMQSVINKYVELYGAAPVMESPSSCCASCCGCLEGLWLVLRHNYIKGISAITCLYLIQLSVVSKTAEYLAKDHFSQVFGCEQGQSCYNSYTGIHSLTYKAEKHVESFVYYVNMLTRLVTILFPMFGSRAIISRYGVPKSLLLFPVICLFTSVILIIYPPNLYMVLLCLLLLEGASAAINTPIKEMLYIPTGIAIQYKARIWIESIGYDSTQFLGYSFTWKTSGGDTTFAATAGNLSTKGGLLCFALALVSFAVARCLYNEFEQKLTSSQPGDRDESFINYQNVPLNQDDDERTEEYDVELPSLS
jgi:AAA family ATP:ADP antiporter